MAKLRFPHPMTLLVGCILLAAALTWLLPAGEYERRTDEATGREVNTLELRLAPLTQPTGLPGPTEQQPGSSEPDETVNPRRKR